ncbi:hypothetical protein SAFG77S_11812 [Streptomyces afghaniensis]
MHDGRLGDDTVEVEEAGVDVFGKTELRHTGPVPRPAMSSEWRTPHSAG